MQKKTAIYCGLFYRRTLWCGCGRYLIGLDPQDYLTKHYKPIIKEDVCVYKMAASHGCMWVGFKDKSYLVVCDLTKTNSVEKLDCL